MHNFNQFVSVSNSLEYVFVPIYIHIMQGHLSATRGHQNVPHHFPPNPFNVEVGGNFFFFALFGKTFIITFLHIDIQLV